jgi:hypothetical protein
VLGENVLRIQLGDMVKKEVRMTFRIASSLATHTHPTKALTRTPTSAPFKTAKPVAQMLLAIKPTTFVGPTSMQSPSFAIPVPLGQVGMIPLLKPVVSIPVVAAPIGDSCFIPKVCLNFVY